VVYHSPLARAAETADLIVRHLPAAELHEDEVAGDYVPYVSEPAELPVDCTDFLGATLPRVLAQFDAARQRRGPELARAAVARFTGAVAWDQDQDVLLVTHDFLIGWLLRDAFDAPPWCWLGVNQGNAALTVIRYAPGRPASVLVHNDTRHLIQEELRWTGFPPQLRV
jgi:probable phosphoglycerate mutase